jgi:hypothetical protein
MAAGFLADAPHGAISARHVRQIRTASRATAMAASIPQIPTNACPEAVKVRRAILARTIPSVGQERASISLDYQTEIGFPGNACSSRLRLARGPNKFVIIQAFV